MLRVRLYAPFLVILEKSYEVAFAEINIAGSGKNTCLFEFVDSLFTAEYELCGHTLRLPVDVSNR